MLSGEIIYNHLGDCAEYGRNETDCPVFNAIVSVAIDHYNGDEQSEDRIAALDDLVVIAEAATQ